MTTDTENKEVYLERPQYVSLEEFCKEPSDRRETFYVDPQDIIFADNIRPIDYDFVDTLAESIKEQGQIQECVGDVIINSEGSLQIRLIAGQHRGLSLIKIFNERKEGEPITKLRIGLVNHELSPEKVIQIQMSENLQNKMTPDQDAVIIYNYWKTLYDIRAERDELVTISEIARSVGRSREKVKDAITFIEGVEPRVRELVRLKQLPYSYALILADLPVEGPFMTTQLELAQIFVKDKKKYTLEKAKKFIATKKTELGLALPLFGGEWEGIKFDNFVRSLNQDSNKNAYALMQWFIGTVKWLDQQGDNAQKARFSDALTDAMDNLGMSQEEFKNKLRPLVSKREFKKLFPDDNRVS